MNLLQMFLPAWIVPPPLPAMPWWMMMSPSATISHLPTEPRTSMLPEALTEKPSSTLPWTITVPRNMTLPGLEVDVAGDGEDLLDVDLAAR